MNDLRYRRNVVLLGNARYGRADQVLDGAKFRIRPTAAEISLGLLNGKWFKPFDEFYVPIKTTFSTSDGETIPVTTKTLIYSELNNEELKFLMASVLESLGQDPLSLLNIPADQLIGDDFDDDWDEDDEQDEEEEEEEEIDEGATFARIREQLKDMPPQNLEMHDLTPTFARWNFQPGDSLLVTLKPQDKTYLFEPEPAAECRAELVEQHDSELRQLIHKGISKKQREYAREIIFPTYANLNWTKDYPGSHWLEVVEKDDELRLLNFGHYQEIASIDYQMFFDFVLDETTQRKLKKRRSSLESEIHDFLNRFDEAITQATNFSKPFEQGGRENVISKLQRVPTAESTFDDNNQLIQNFFEAQKQRGKKESDAGKRCSDVAWFANYLGNYETMTLEFASFDELETFFFDWYPRKVINSTANHVKQMASSLRDYYRFLVASNVIRSAAFAEAMYELRELAGEKIELYHRLPADSEDLMAMLWDW
ncbi:MAG: hypothetical protein SF097_05455 [Acidobacteriota bacterium]|nr:hypothetical protein [Acidobacteriota bacterium]